MTELDPVDLEGDESFVLSGRNDAVIQEETPAYGYLKLLDDKIVDP